MTCKTITKQANKICIGNLNKKIKIQTSSFIDSNTPNQPSGIEFADILEPWAMIKTFKEKYQREGHEYVYILVGALLMAKQIKFN